MKRKHDDEEIIGQLILLVDVVEGTSYDLDGNVEGRYKTTRFRHATLAIADGPDRFPDLVGDLLAEMNERGGEPDPDGVVLQGINFIHDYENGTL